MSDVSWAFVVCWLWGHGEMVLGGVVFVVVVVVVGGGGRGVKVGVDAKSRPNDDAKSSQKKYEQREVELMSGGSGGVKSLSSELF